MDEQKIAFEKWADKKKTAPWKVKAAAVSNKWGVGKELSEADYEAAIVAVTSHVAR